jgi:hypothetical protein
MLERIGKRVCRVCRARATCMIGKDYLCNSCFNERKTRKKKRFRPIRKFKYMEWF